MNSVIPTRADDHALAQSRRPMDMMSQGWSMRRFQASQQWSTMSRQEANTRLDNPLSRRNCQMFSTGFNSGARAGSSTSVRLSGTTRSLAQCHPARSISMTPWAPGATACATSARGRLMACVSHRGSTQAAPLPCCVLLRADRPEDVDRTRPLIVRGAGPGAPSGPAARDLVLLADTGLVLPPQLVRGALREARPDRFQGGGETFLKSSSASGFWA